jgi:hypothetical protein
MAEHKQPTTEELKANLENVQKELEKPEDENLEETTEDESKEEDAGNADERQADESTDESGEEEKETDNDDNQSEEEVTPEDDTAKKFAASTRESQRLAEDEKKINDAFHEAQNIKLTEDDIKEEYPEWDLMSDTEKKLAKDNIINKKRFEILETAAAERRVVTQWDEKVDTYIENPKTLVYHADLEGKQDAFKAYAKDKSRRNVNFDLIVKSFLYEQMLKKPEINKNSKMFEMGTGGDTKKVEPKNEKVSLADAAKLRDRDYAGYKKLLIEGKIATE